MAGKSGGKYWNRKQEDAWGHSGGVAPLLAALCLRRTQSGGNQSYQRPKKKKSSTAAAKSRIPHAQALYGKAMVLRYGGRGANRDPSQCARRPTGTSWPEVRPRGSPRPLIRPPYFGVWPRARGARQVLWTLNEESGS